MLGLTGVPAPSLSSLSSVDLVQRAERVPIPIITDHGYTIVESQKEVTLRYGKQWIVRKAGKEVDILGIDAMQRTVTVLEASNDNDKAPDKIKFRGIILSVWEAKSGFKAKDLRQVVWTSVTNRAVQTSMSKALASILNKTTIITTILPQTAAYTEMIDNNPAGKGVKQMLAQYVGLEGRIIAAVDIDDSENQDVSFWLE